MQLTCCAGTNDNNSNTNLSLFFVGTLFRTKPFPLLKLMHDVQEDIMLKEKIRKLSNEGDSFVQSCYSKGCYTIDSH